MTLLEAVREQYAGYPYPVRDPEDERTRLLQGLLSQVSLVNHLFWAGRRRFDVGFRALDAGCGTGDTAICLGEQLRGTGASVVALDFSPASLAVARERAAVRGLDNVEFVEGSIEHLPASGMEPFDYVVASGVLHHLDSPEVGLAAVRDMLKPDGGLAIMVYGRDGRSEVYQLQRLFSLLAPPTMAPQQRLRVVQRTLARFRPEHPATLYGESFRREIDDQGDAGLFDLFLHAQDRSYTVPEIYRWLEGARLRLLDFDFPVGYDPRTWNARIDYERFTTPERHALAELLHGRMANHTFFATRADYEPPPPPPPDDPAATPAWSYYDESGNRDRAIHEGRQMRVVAGVYTLQVTLTAISRALLQRVDSHTLLGEILHSTEAAFAAASAEKVRAEWLRLFGQLNSVHYLVMNPAD